MGSLERFVHCRKFRSKHYGWLVDDPSRGTFHNAITRIVSYFDSPATTLFLKLSFSACAKSHTEW